MALKEILLKKEYRSDRDDIIGEFFIPCLSNCIEYDRCIEYVSIKSLTTLAFGTDNFAERKAKMRIIAGHRFGAFDLNLLTRIFASKKSVSSGGGPISDIKISRIQEMVDEKRIEVKVAVPSSEQVVGSFSERIGIFRDAQGDAVAFSGTSNETFDRQNTNFESVDVFTSWDDAERVRQKIEDFEKLWANETRYVKVYDIEQAERDNLLKYSSEWALEAD